MTGVKSKKKTKKQKVEEVVSKGREELVNLEKIELIYGKKKSDKASRMETIKKGESFYFDWCELEFNDNCATKKFVSRSV